MLPRFPINNFANLATVNAKLVCNELLSYIAMFIHAPDFNNHSVGKLCRGRSLPSYVTVFAYLIVIVVALGSEKKMERVAARRVVASVEHVESFWNVSVVKLPRNAMREENKFPIGVIPLNLSVAVTLRLAVPEPAPIGLFNHAPKAFGNGTREACNSLAERGFTGDDLYRFDVVSHIVLARAAPYRGSAFALSGYQ